MERLKIDFSKTNYVLAIALCQLGFSAKYITKHAKLESEKRAYSIVYKVGVKYFDYRHGRTRLSRQVRDRFQNRSMTRARNLVA